MSLSKPKDDNCVKALVRKYFQLLQERPILTKSCTSACTGAVANIMSQYLATAGGRPVTINWRSVLAFALTGFFFTAPAMHHFYRILEQIVPKTASRAALKRMLIDRLLYTPIFLLMYLYCVTFLEGHGVKLTHQKVMAVYKIALKLNWKILTIVQYIVINYVPQQYRVLVGNFVSLGWNCVIALKRRG